MDGLPAAADPELLPALLVELARMQREQAEAEEAAISVRNEPQRLLGQVLAIEWGRPRECRFAAGATN